MRGGKSLSQALDARRDVFSRFYVNIIRAGEAGGALGTVLTRLADTMERNKELRESVMSALIYPTILIGVAVLSLMLILAYVVPQFEQTFAQAGSALPLPTQVVIFLGTGVKQWWWAIAAVAVLWFLWMRSGSARSRRAHALGRAPAALAADRRRRDQGGDGALRAHARDAARQRRDAARRPRDRQGHARQHRARDRARRRDRAAARGQGLRAAAGARPGSTRSSPCR